MFILWHHLNPNDTATYPFRIVKKYSWLKKYGFTHPIEMDVDLPSLSPKTVTSPKDEFNNCQYLISLEDIKIAFCPIKE